MRSDLRSRRSVYDLALFIVYNTLLLALICVDGMTCCTRERLQAWANHGLVRVLYEVGIDALVMAFQVGFILTMIRSGGR
jgi:hypothetical protein